MTRFGADVRRMNTLSTGVRAVLPQSTNSLRALPRRSSIRSNPFASYSWSASESPEPIRRRGGSNLSERFSRAHPHLAIGTSILDVHASNLSAAGQAHEGSQNAASRLAREGEEYTLIGSVRIPKRPQAPGEEGQCPQFEYSYYQPNFNISSSFRPHLRMLVRLYNHLMTSGLV